MVLKLQNTIHVKLKKFIHTSSGIHKKIDITYLKTTYVRIKFYKCCNTLNSATKQVIQVAMFGRALRLKLSRTLPNVGRDHDEGDIVRHDRPNSGRNSNEHQIYECGSSARREKCNRMHFYVGHLL